jgi:hypothetical protein
MKIALMVLVTAGLSIGAVLQNLDKIQLSGQSCGLEGDAKNVSGNALDRDKNRYTDPVEDDIDPGVSLAAMLAPGDDLDRFDQKKAATITGYVVNVKAGGTESCNCHAKSPGDCDTHIELALSKNAPETQRVIVEVTPRLRILKKEESINWTTPALEKTIKGHWVQVTGWLLFDSAHIGEAVNTHPVDPKKQNWRATCWEIHPVTAIKVLAGPPPDAELAPVHLSAIQGVLANTLQRSPEKQAEIAKRNEAILSKFDESEIDDDAPKGP